MNKLIEQYKTQVAAWRDGKNPWITVDNTNPNETAKKKIRRRANEVWGDPKFAYSIWSEGKKKT